MKFSPTKCVFLGDSNQPQRTLRLYNELLPTKKEKQYLGMAISTKGLEFQKNAESRCAKMRNTTMILHKAGMNLTGLPQEASARIYKTFLRPMLEYGMQLQPLSTAQVQSAERAQAFALRKICST